MGACALVTLIFSTCARVFSSSLLALLAGHMLLPQVSCAIDWYLLHRWTHTASFPEFFSTISIKIVKLQFTKYSLSYSLNIRFILGWFSLIQFDLILPSYYFLNFSTAIVARYLAISNKWKRWKNIYWALFKYCIELEWWSFYGYWQFLF